MINRKSNNFDLLRLIFAVTVAMVHTSELSQIDFLSQLTRLLNSAVAVDSFFVISGFLIFMSFESSLSLLSYANKRIRRIFPGYFTVIIFCAFFLFFFSSASFTEYFSSDFLKYLFFNLLTLNFLHQTLPGVFENNTIQAVNGILWTIKIEVMFYFSVPVIAYIIARSNKILVLLSIYVLSIVYSMLMFKLASHEGGDIFLRLERQLPGQMAFFISGAFLYYFYEQFCNNALIMFIIAVLILLVDKFVFDLYFLYPAALSVVIIYFALVFKFVGNFGKWGDFSFGVYIWHFPILQLFVQYNVFDQPVIGLVFLSLSIFMAAYLSWHFVEKKFLFKSSHYIVAEKS